MMQPTAAQIGQLVRAHLALLASLDQIADRAMAAPTHRPLGLMIRRALRTAHPDLCLTARREDAA